MPPPRPQYTNTPTEADTCRAYVVPKLQVAGWEVEPHSLAEQRQFTDGRIVLTGTKAIRQKAKKADYLLRRADLQALRPRSKQPPPAQRMQHDSGGYWRLNGRQMWNSSSAMRR
jgi:hypothetical protein